MLYGAPEVPRQEKEKTRTAGGTVSYVKILRFYKKKFLIGPLLGEVRFFRVVLGLRGMKKKFELGQKFFFFFLQLWTLNMTQYSFFENSVNEMLQGRLYVLIWGQNVKFYSP
jgi:hypothetical protein